MFDLKKHKFFVSCQAVEGEPLFGGDTVLKLARAAVLGGAQGIRTSQIDNIKKIMAENFNLPIIGLIKKEYSGSDVYITPTIEDLDQLIQTNVDIVAIDATLRQRPAQTLTELVQHFQTHKNPHQLLMADCSNKEDIENAINLGFDIISTTMRGYTAETQNMSNTANDYEFIKWCRQISQDKNVILVAEGGLNTPADARAVLDLGVDVVVVGSAITRPQFITKTFLQKIIE
ncbi:N-acylglucosamine-6-phosphate 2-epimerase [Mycoplasmoides fastidiosum]|uniref:Putative N-acetylmannosamine-6-phosphate 2-epimerase n=1 Tax=Mycoplasmoides fastidiosum TaxID=92758 RepID=A0ABU0LYW0_9BACT|nr:N-acetylmannosamine-6-phosphate 2-epimerase [Mycoplasmoides fastidiosum]MDQ0513879.1 N-acylglucosamine-6-phosphate 2-epimerase [Mycoplasmoides fastidiosum]UUD37707.1 N-acetylmannosamine-6-phosphate 2-epimerase [Mycoplasmoides fastidiosum]